MEFFKQLFFRSSLTTVIILPSNQITEKHPRVLAKSNSVGENMKELKSYDHDFIL